MPCDDCSRTESCPPCPSEPDRDDCRCGPGELCGHCFEGAFAAGRVVILPEEPPLTPEEEEQAPSDGALPPPEGPEYARCMQCGHPEHDHAPEHGDCFACECPAYRAKPDFETPEAPPCSEVEGCDGNCCAKAPPPPQPDRRPPYAVAYSVQGHLYEVALPGDATVHAVDGALVIRHHLGPVAGIVQVLPVINKENHV